MRRRNERNHQDGGRPGRHDRAVGAVSVSSDTAYAAEGDKWSDSAVTDWYTDNPDQTSYTISTPEQLAGLAQLVNGTATSTEGGTSTAVTFEGVKITLAADINLSGKEWTPIGDGARSDSTYTGDPFKGTFIGGNHTITGLTISSTTGANNAIGLFGVIDGGNVSGLTFLNVNIDVSTSELAGSVAGLIVGGGVVKNVTIGSETDKSKIVAAKGVGGIAGRMISAGTVDNCTNYAEITGTSGNRGGIVGAAYYAPTGDGLNIIGCTNYGAITSTAGGYTGGIVGLSTADVYGCHNEGAVSAVGTSIGGVVGEQKNGGTVEKCTNAGDVSNKSAGTTSAGTGTGGVIGWTRYSNEYDNTRISVIRCSNTGDVTSDSYGVGGIVGLGYHSLSVIGCDSTGTFTGDYMVAGIVGSLQSAADGNVCCSEGCWFVFTGNTATDVTTVSDGANVDEVLGHWPSSDLNNPATPIPHGSYWTVYGNKYVASGTTTEAVFDGIQSYFVIDVTDSDGTVTRYGYNTLADAVSNAVDGDTITMMADASTEKVTVNKNITLDLGGHTLTITEANASNRWGLTFESGTSTITNGTIVDERAKDVSTKVAVYVHGTNSTVQLTTSDLTITTYPSTAGGYSYALRVEGNAAAYLNSGTTIEETANDGATGTVVGVAVFGAQPKADSYTYMTELSVNNGVSIKTSGFAISGNGDGNNGTVITINGGTIESSEVQAIYHPQDGILNINGGSITGDTGIEMRAGTLNMTGGEVTGTGNPLVSGTNPGGSTTSGAGIAIVQHTTAYNIDVTVKDGTVSGYNAVFEKNTESSTEEELEKVTISLKGGVFKAINGGEEPVSIEDAGKVDAAVTGGTYNGDVSKYVPTGQGIEIGDDGTVTPPFSFDYLSMIVVTTQFTVPVTSASGTQVSLTCDDTDVSYDASTGVFTIDDANNPKTFTITGTVGGYTDTMTVSFMTELVTSTDTDTGLMAVYVSNPDESALTKLEEYPQVTDWIFMDISRLDGSTQALTFNFGSASDSEEKLFVIHFNDDGTVDYPTVEIVDGVYKITPSGFSLFAFGFYTGEDPTPEPTPEPEPEPEPEPTPENPPAGGDDDESLPPIIRPGTSSSSADDDTVTIVACAAAAAVAAIMAVFLIVLYRKD